MKVKATSFADPADVAAFNRCKAEGGSDSKCFKVGDNGIGFTGLICSTEKVNYCALPKDVWMAKWGSKAAASGKAVIVTYRGQEVAGFLGDTLPSSENIKNGAQIDLGPGFLKAFRLKPPLSIQVEWRWG